ncbi:MAG: AI-2E family transporter [Anaerolineales bacterium]|jgi:predicted PurR-regulated permease PerM
MTTPAGNSTPNPENQSEAGSPFWNTNTKLIVGIALVALAAGILAQLRPILTPLFMALITSYLLYPMVEGLSENTFLSWRAATNLIFILLLIILISSLTASGVAIVNQFENLIDIVNTFLVDLPTTVQEFLQSDPVLTIPIIEYEIDLGEYVQSLNIDLLAISEQALSAIQPVLGQAGNILTRVATSAFGILGWGGFILAVAYLTLGEAKQSSKFLRRELESISNDIGRMSREIGYIWNAFLRGQVLVFFLSATTMFILMSILGVRYALGLAILAGFARFIPYVGQVVSAIVNALVAFFLAGGNYLGLEPFPYMLLVVGLAFLHDQIYDTLVVPRLIGFVLGVHPALVLIVAIIATRWIGLLGLLLAAPVLASFQLITSYVIRKMLDQDPWPDPEVEPPTLREQFKDLFGSTINFILQTAQSVADFFRKLYSRITTRNKNE